VRGNYAWGERRESTGVFNAEAQRALRKTEKKQRGRGSLETRDDTDFASKFKGKFKSAKKKQIKCKEKMPERFLSSFGMTSKFKSKFKNKIKNKNVEKKRPT
jgi:hypothetical protein